MAFRNYRQHSRDMQWGQDSDSMDIEQINCGSLLRIANASEKMALRHTELIDKATRLEQKNRWLEDRVTARDRAISNLKGQITKLKNKATKL